MIEYGGAADGIFHYVTQSCDLPVTLSLVVSYVYMKRMGRKGKKRVAVWPRPGNYLGGSKASGMLCAGKYGRAVLEIFTAFGAGSRDYWLETQRGLHILLIVLVGTLTLS